MGRFRNQRNWNELRWESEIRRDERRINRYFAELASCIDLPGEEDIIAGNIAENSDLVCSGSGIDSENMRCWSYLAARDEDCDEEEYSVRRPEQTVLDLLDHLAAQWNETYVSLLPDDCICIGLCVSCFYGKLLARMADFADSGADPDCSPGLHITLGKRVISDIQALEQALQLLPVFSQEFEDLKEKHCHFLSCIHDRVIGLLNWSRNA